MSNPIFLTVNNARNSPFFKSLHHKTSSRELEVLYQSVGVLRLHLQKRSDSDKFRFILWDAPWPGKQPSARRDGGGCGITLGFALEEDVGETPTHSTPQLSPVKRGRSEGELILIILHWVNLSFSSRGICTPGAAITSHEPVGT